MPRAIETHCRMIGAKAPCISRDRPAKQALALATEPRAKREARSVLQLLPSGIMWLVIPVSSQVATFEQSENVAITGARPKKLLAMRGVVSVTASICACAR